MQTLYALDLTDLPGADDLWRVRAEAKRPEENRLCLPTDGFASPLGFWFAAAGSWGSVVAPLRVEVRDLGEQDVRDHSGNGKSRNVSLVVPLVSCPDQAKANSGSIRFDTALDRDRPNDGSR